MLLLILVLVLILVPAHLESYRCCAVNAGPRKRPCHHWCVYVCVCVCVCVCVLASHGLRQGFRNWFVSVLTCVCGTGTCMQVDRYRQAARQKNSKGVSGV